MALTEEQIAKSLLTELHLIVSLGEDIDGVAIQVTTTDGKLAEWCAKEFQTYVASHQGLFVRVQEHSFVCSGPIHIVILSNVSKDVEESPSVALDFSLHWKLLGHICDAGWEPFQYQRYRSNPRTSSTARCFRKLLRDQ